MCSLYVASSSSLAVNDEMTASRAFPLDLIQGVPVRLATLLGDDVFPF
jgi:hypothetical protein